MAGVVPRIGLRLNRVFYPLLPHTLPLLSPPLPPPLQVPDRRVVGQFLTAYQDALLEAL